MLCTQKTLTAVAVGLSLIMSQVNLSGQQFTNVAEELGVIHTMSSSDGFGGGVTFFDINNDGLDDLTFVNDNDMLSIFLNNGDGFTPFFGLPVIQGEARHAVWVDYDNDGDNDLFVTTFAGGSCRMFRNEGDMVFTDVTNDCGLAGLISTNYGATFADYDRDGFLDLYLCRYEGFGNSQDPLNTNALFRNNGDGTFSDVTQAAGVSDGVQLSFMGGWIDFNHDGWPDLYVINDKTGWHNNLYINKTDGTFEVITEAAGAFMYNDDPMSATFADFDNDGDLDWYSSNTGHASTRARLMVNQSGETFSEQAENYGVALQAWSWGAAFVDYNNDSFLDLFVTTGYTTNHWQAEIASVLYRSEEGDVFTQMPDNEFIGGTVAASYSVAVGDIDNDGYPDLAVLNAKNYDSFLFHNNGSGNAFIKVSLQGTISNAMAVGSWITVNANGQTYSHYTRCGENYCGQNSQHHIFGLADAEIVDSIEILYPSGHIDVFTDLEVNQHYTFIEGASLVAPIVAGNTVLCEGQSTTIIANSPLFPEWNIGGNQSTLTVSEPGAYFYSYTTDLGIVVYSDTINVVASQDPNPSIVTTSPTCNDFSNGVIEVAVDDDLGDMTLFLNGQAADWVSQNLPAGSYILQILTAEGCAYEYAADLANPSPFEAVAIIDQVACAGGEAEAQVITFGGAPPFTVYWNGIETNMLSEGEYQLTVTDSNGCQASEFYSVSQPPALQGQLIVSDESFSVEVSGGSPPYSVSFFSPVGEMLQDPAPFSIEGVYQVQIQDDNDCLLVLTHLYSGTWVENQSTPTPSFYPNPAREYLTIDAHSALICDVELFDLSGRLVIQINQINQTMVTLHIEMLPPGIYIVRIKNQYDGLSTQRLVIR